MRAVLLSHVRRACERLISLTQVASAGVQGMGSQMNETSDYGVVHFPEIEAGGLGQAGYKCADLHNLEFVHSRAPQ